MDLNLFCMAAADDNIVKFLGIGGSARLKIVLMKTEKLNLFHGMNSKVIALVFESEQFFTFLLFFHLSGSFFLRSFCIERRKEFSRKVERSEVESFYWNKLMNKSFSFQSEQFLLCLLF